MKLSLSLFSLIVINISISAQSGNLIVNSYPPNHSIKIYRVDYKPEQIITFIDQGKTPYSNIDLPQGGYRIEWLDKSKYDFFNIEDKKTTKVIFKNESSYSLIANNSKNNYACLFFGEKSGFSEAFDYYKVDSILRKKGINIIRCNLEWDKSINEYKYYTITMDGRDRIIGPFNDEDATLMKKIVEDIGWDYGWLHFFVTTIVLTKK